MSDDTSSRRTVVEFVGATHLRYRLVMSTLAQRAIRISQIRVGDGGLRDYEASFLRLLEKVSVGARVRISSDGTVLEYVPGFINNGAALRHDCAVTRGVGYYLEPLLLLAPFGKQPLAITLTGVTNNELDVSPDSLRTVTLPLLANFGLDADSLELKIVRRGAPPLGGGAVEFSCAPVKELNVVMLLDDGLVRRVRGIAYATRVSPAICTRVVSSARSLLNQAAADVYIYSDHFSGADGVLSPGFGLVLVAETTTGALISAETCARKSELPEDVGRRAAALLLEQVARRGMCDSTNQPMLLLYMLLCDEEVSRIRFGPLSPFTMQFLRDVRSVFGCEFKLEESDDGTVIVSGVGVGFKNLARRLK
jgi:RNA 3'-terminal phosphate cyclase-like protein